MTTTTHRELDDWLREGRIEPMPDALATHVTSCGDCRAALAELDELRSWFPDDSAELSQDAQAAIRFRLQSEARRHGARAPESAAPVQHAGSRSHARARVWLWAAAAVVLLALGGVASRFVAGGDDAGLTARSTASRVTVSAAAGSVVREIDPQTYRLSDGSAWFDVARRAPGARFRVLVGAERVEVHGTRFRVRAEANVLSSVEVAHGVVSVHLASGVVHRLTAGQRYDRDAEVAAASASAANATTPSVTTPSSTPASASASAAAAGGRDEAAPSPNPAPSATTTAASNVSANAATARSRSVPSNVQLAGRDSATVDRAFHDAWQLRRAGRHDEAARAFDALLSRGGLGARRADVLYWSARAHESAGRTQLAAQRFEKLVRSHPRAWHSAEARRRLEASPQP